jgi:cell division septum initiation protein DivIVA
LRREDIDRLQKKFDIISAELDTNREVDENIDILEKSTQALFAKSFSYELEVKHLKEQVDELDQINQSLRRECFANTITKPEL